ncbi:trans-sialidase [Trypanosoma cruzi cruzi]|uniref:Putative trans-sialidase, Group VI n=1 Tax=Trypanosoma cruzi TaxID=5693 RepID=A0A2V2VA35_TRYCR|nr:trans-sialidase [Trypanosoma cruzi cruzi]PWU93104.1 putative trans-sialidase, Group VI [Trypanosoma cruzi]
MLSRVSVVKAPRTHNRRRVTGSSGRRREGRESEPQRPNMSRHLLYSVVLLLLVVMMCCVTGGASSKEKSPAPIPPPKTYFDWRDVEKVETVSSLRVPSLVGMNGDVFAVAEAQCTGKKDAGEGSFTGIASELLTLTGENPKEELDKSKLKTQVLEECSSDKGNCPSQTAAKEGGSQSETKVHVSQPTTVVDGSDIYMLAGKYSNKGTSDGQAGDWGLLLVSGNVSTVDSKKRIYWGDTYGLPWAFFVKQHESLTQLINGGGSGVKMKDGTLVFPVEATKKANNNEEEVKTTTVSLTIYSSDNAASWKLSKGMSDGGCSDPSVVEWKDKKLMMMTACDDGRRRVYESDDKGEEWTEALGTLSRVWGNEKGEGAKGVGSGFITATVGDDKRNVMLVTLPVYSEKDGKKEKGKLHLWLTDNTHIVDIGPVSEKDDDVTASSLLYKSAGNGDKNDELIALYEKKGDENNPSHSLWSVLLTEQLQHVKEVLETWKEVDQTVSKLCTTSISEKDGSSVNACSPTVEITDGLVGFLSGNFSENTWRDEYLGVNATVKVNGGGAAAATGYADNGVKFTGAWAEWPVGEQGENQLYHFVNYNFTLVATVSIDGEPTEGNIPLMGVKMAGDEKEKKLMELSYEKEKKWILLCGGGQNKELSRDWEETKKKDHVVILLRNGTQGSAYVDGQRVGGNEACALGNKDSEAISHFYIGGDGGAKGVSGIEEDVSVTVTNVLLYNRPLDDAEITAINTNKRFIQRLTHLKNVARDTLSPDVDTQPTLAAVSESTRHGQQPLKPEPLKGEEGAGSGGASNSAKTTVTTHSVGSQSAEQLPSGGSHDGNESVSADSSSDGNPAVGTVGGDTTQGNESPQIPAGNPDTADANTPTTEGEGQDEPTANPEEDASSGENGEPTEGTDGQGELHPRDRGVNATALSSSLGTVSQGNNSDGGTVSESRMLPSLLLLLLGLWGLAAL